MNHQISVTQLGWVFGFFLSPKSATFTHLQFIEKMDKSIPRLLSHQEVAEEQQQLGDAAKAGAH